MNVTKKGKEKIRGNRRGSIMQRKGKVKSGQIGEKDLENFDDGEK